MKVDDGLGKLKTHITGVLVNARSVAYAYVDICEYSHDPNLTIHLILKVLVEEQEKVRYFPAFKKNRNHLRYEIFTERKTTPCDVCTNGQLWTGKQKCSGLGFSRTTCSVGII